MSENSIKFELNAEMYPKDVLFHAAYVLIEDFYFYFDKNHNYYEIEITSKSHINDEKELEDMKNKFLDELVESSAYLKQLEKTSGIREILLQRALLTHDKDNFDFETLKKELEEN